MISIGIEAQLNSLSWYYSELTPIINLFRIETGGINGEIIDNASARANTRQCDAEGACYSYLHLIYKNIFNSNTKKHKNIRYGIIFYCMSSAITIIILYRTIVENVEICFYII